MGKPQPRDGQRLVQPYAQRRRRARVGELRALGKSEYRGIDSSCRSISGFLVTSILSLFFTATPVGRKVMRPFPLMARNYETDRPATTSSYPSTTLVAEQDKPVVGRIVPRSYRSISQPSRTSAAWTRCRSGTGSV